MHWLAVYLLVVAVAIGGGVTKESGIEHFWTDDYKVFEQVYGKTSDKEIYGATLPPPIRVGLDTKKSQATEKKERFINFQTDPDDYNTHDDINKFNILQTAAKTKPKANFKFISNNDFRPISQSSDPETYNYLKHLEELEKVKATKLPKGTGGFKPYNNYFGPNPEETDAYKSIQDILDAHEANKENGEASSSKYLTYREKEKTNKRKEKKPNGNVKGKPRCVSGRCRNRGPAPKYRSRPRPYYRKIKKIVTY